MKRVIQNTTIILSLMVMGVRPAGNAGNAPARYALSIYAKESQLVVGFDTDVVIEIQNRGGENLDVSGPVKMQVVKWHAEDGLPNDDPTPDGDPSGTLAITSYTSNDSKLLSVRSNNFPSTYHAAIGEDALFRVNVPAKLIAAGENRLRVSLFTDGKQAAASNIINIVGRPKHASTRPSRN